MNIDSLLHSLFGDSYAGVSNGQFIWGSGHVRGHDVAVVGTSGAAPIGVEIALQMAGEVLRVIREAPGKPILLLIDTSGQRLSRRDELVGINGYLAHLAKCIEMARLRGHRVISLVYSLAVSGGYLSSGMLADACFALPDAEIKVMGLPAMARVTKIPLERLETLSKASPVFAPGVSNYMAMGSLARLWVEDLAGELAAALNEVSRGDRRRHLGEQRGGRVQARSVAKKVRECGG